MEETKPRESNHADSLWKSVDADYEAYLNRTVQLGDEGFGRIINKQKVPFLGSSSHIISKQSELG